MIAPDPDLESKKRTRGGRERLLKAVAGLFRERGISGTSVQMIADRLGVSKAAIFYHFKSRDDIIDALLAPVLADTEQAVTELKQLPKAEQSGATCRALIEIGVTHRQISNLVYFDRFAVRPDLSAKMDLLIDQMVKLIARDQTATETTRARILVYGVTILLGENRRRKMPDNQLRQCIEAVVADFLNPRNDAAVADQ